MKFKNFKTLARVHTHTHTHNKLLNKNERGDINETSFKKQVRRAS